jgi:nitrous oxidase accessory protein NosD
MVQVWTTWVLAASLILSTALVALVGIVSAPTTVHAPIYINGNAAFTPANGVVGGSGTFLDPYIIEGWEVSGGLENGIEIANTNAFFVVRDVFSHSGNYGILLKNVTNGQVVASRVSGNTYGIGLDISSGITLDSVHSDNNTVAGMLLWKSIDVSIIAAEVRDHPQGAGIRIDQASRVAIGGAALRFNKLGLYVASSTEIEVRASEFSDNQDGANTWTSKATLASSRFLRNAIAGIGVHSSPNDPNEVRIERNTFSLHARCAISVRGRGAVIGGNEFTDNQCGVGVSWSGDVIVMGNNMTRNRAGIAVHDSRPVSILSNRIQGYNNPTQPDTGISLFAVDRGLVKANVVWDNAIVRVDQGSAGTLIAFNNVTRDYGPALLGDLVQGALFHHNSFVSPPPTASVTGSGNQFDDGYPSGGNFWSDYSGVDQCSGPAQDVCPDPDGIGDTGFSVGGPSSDVDRYPLMRPFVRTNVLPVASFEVAPRTAILGEQMVFDASTSYDPDGIVFDYRWDFGDGTVASGATASHTYASEGDFQVTLTVQDDDEGQSSVQHTASVQPPGLLRVTTAVDLHPDWGVVGKISVDGVPRDEWGLTWVKMAPGTHVIRFSDVPGLGTPPEASVNVEAGATSTAAGVYAAHGWLRVMTDPPLPGTISVDGIPRNDFGVWMAVPPGTYEISFGAVRGYSRPNSVVATVEPERLTEVTGRYVYDGSGSGPDLTRLGFLRVVTSVGDFQAGVQSRISVDGVVRDEWGLSWVKLPIGTHTVSFSGVPALETPAPQTVEVRAGEVTYITGFFRFHGSLRVITSPAVPATIFVDGIPRNDWGMWQSMPAGTYTVSFGSVPGYPTPLPQQVTVTEGRLTVVTGSYATVHEAELVWARQFGALQGSGVDTSVTDMDLDATRLFIAGLTNAVMPGQSNAGGLDAFVRRYDRDGNTVWTRQFGTTSDDHAGSIALGPDWLYVGGTTQGAFPGASNNGRPDAFLRK